MTARVIRGGNRTEIKARELVPGDIVGQLSATLSVAII